jgi:thiamine pyrophosphate-dependent acetolactate synthase large subunit-like protein
MSGGKDSGAGKALGPQTPGLEEPNGATRSTAIFGSDVMAETLHALDIPYIALNPGASYRGLHDSIVNYLGNENPKMLLCLHEEHAVAIAQGWAKITGKAMAVALHSNVGLMHGTMAIFNAWCDRVPMVILGATGNVDAMKRRPWIEWIHTSRDQGALVRNYVKWDDQPGSVGAARESILRAAWQANTAPMGPTYVVLDVELQENSVSEPLPPITPQRYMPPVVQKADAALCRSAVEMLLGAKRPLILAGRMSRSLDTWNQLIAVAEKTGAQVATDTKIAASFPTDHPLHVGAFGSGPAKEVLQAITDADVIVSLDWVDLAGTIKTAIGDKEVAAKVVQVSLDHVLHNGWSMDYMGLPTVDLFIPSETDSAIVEMARALEGKPKKPVSGKGREALSPDLVKGPISVAQMFYGLRQVTDGRDVSLLQVPLSYNPQSWHFRHPLDYIGTDGGGGIGSGPGLSIGAALALMNSGRLPIAVFGDGNFMMGCSAIWTAVHYNIPVMIVVANNQSFYNDELHQERVARMRNRPVENKWIGQRMDNPELDLATVARGQGAVGFGPVKDASEIVGVFKEALKELEAGKCVVVDVRVLPGYA